MRRLEAMQWFGLLAAPLAWTTQLVVGFYAASATCARGTRHWGVPLQSWQLALGLAAATVAVAAQVTTVTLWRELREVEEDAPGPLGRLHFFSVASLVGNTLFLALIVLTAVGALAHVECRQG
jgi:hypothetical protein